MARHPRHAGLEAKPVAFSGPRVVASVSMAETDRTILERIDARLTLVEDRQNQLIWLGVQILQGVTMANQALTDLTSQMNTATNAISERIDRLITGLQDVATPEQLAELGVLRDHLNALGQDPANPIPTLPAV